MDVGVYDVKGRQFNGYYKAPFLMIGGSSIRNLRRGMPRRGKGIREEGSFLMDKPQKGGARNPNQSSLLE